MNQFLKLKIVFTAICLFLTSFACKKRSNHRGNTKTVSAHSQILALEISDGIIRVPAADSDEVINEKIRAQLSYLAGNLESFSASVNLSRGKLSILSKEADKDPLFSLVKYEAKLELSWPKETKYNTVMHFVLPPGTDDTDSHEVYKYHNSKFYAAYREKCIDPHSPEKPSYKFWDYLSPYREGCPFSTLLKTDQLNTSFVTPSENDYEIALATAVVKKSGLTTQEMKPEYGQLWKDGKLVIVGIFTPDSSIYAEDFGTKGMYQTIQKLVEKYGEFGSNGKKKAPIANFDSQLSLPELLKNPPKDSIYRFSLNTPRGLIKAVFFLRDDIQLLRDAPLDSQPESIKILKTQLAGIEDKVDVFAYFGHSALGKSIRSFLQLPDFKSGQYSILWIAACTSFMHVDNSIQELNQTLNPGSSPYKYFDFIATGTLSYFNLWQDDFIALTEGLVTESKTYKQILEGFGPKQRPIVFGEEDNGKPF